MRRLFVTLSVLLIAGLAYAAARAPAGSGPSALVVTEPTAPEPADAVKAVRVVYPPSNETMTPSAEPRAEVADAGAAPADPAQAPATAAQPQPSGLQPNIDAVLRATARIDLNTASVGDLDRIPGGGRIGRAIARHRPYRSVEDLLTKHVLRQRVYDRIKDEVAVQ